MHIDKNLNYNFSLFSFAKTLVTSVCYFSFSKVKDLAITFFGGAPAILNSELAWHQNLALLQDAQKNVDITYVKTRNKFKFLAVNYLNKVAPLMPNVARLMSWNFFESTFQVSPYSPYQYHRAFFRYRSDISEPINKQKFALANKSPLILTDTDQFEQFLSLKFIVLNKDNTHEWKTLLLKAMEKKVDLLFDFTEELRDKILTEGQADKEKSFLAHFNQLKNEIHELIQSTEDEKSAQAFLKQKSTAIARVKFECSGGHVSGMKVLPVFCDLTPKNVLQVHPALAHSFVEETGIALGAIRLRRLVPEAFPLPDKVAGSKSNFSETYFKQKNDFIDAVSSRTFERIQDKPHVAVQNSSHSLNFNNL